MLAICWRVLRSSPAKIADGRGCVADVGEIVILSRIVQIGRPISRIAKVDCGPKIVCAKLRTLRLGSCISGNAKVQ